MLLEFKYFETINNISKICLTQEELDLSAPNKAAMLTLPLEKKWQIWTSRRGAAEESCTGLSSNPEDYTASLQVGSTQVSIVDLFELF